MNARNTLVTVLLIAIAVAAVIFLSVKWDRQGMAAATTALTYDIARVDAALEVGEARLQSIDDATERLRTASGDDMVGKIAAEQAAKLSQPLKHSGDVQALLEELQMVRQDLFRQQAEQLKEASTLRRLLEKLNSKR